MYLKSILSYLEFLKETVLRSQMFLYHMWVIYDVSNIWVIGQKYSKAAVKHIDPGTMLLEWSFIYATVQLYNFGQII